MTAGHPCSVLLTDTTYREHAAEREVLSAAGASLLVADPPPRDEAALLAHPEIGSVQALMVELAPITAAVLDAAPQCRIVARYGVGLDNIDLEAAALRARQGPRSCAGAAALSRTRPRRRDRPRARGRMA